MQLSSEKEEQVVFTTPTFTIGTIIAIGICLVGLLVAIEVVPVNALSVGGVMMATGLAIILR